ncbi:MAG: RimK family alpha-L-glutamate ligase [Bacteroidia bacterium]|nr:RimK family alpha-L-glutamate ligase [Bacteroidia bacterium]NNF30964.1 RimK family alpha-L-glutamate ligase [Flavobacteriaceae bacterium]MBT8274926.1 RimK family alpha-L-glutamate ligase [Bacteroidia bacterium]NNJ82609.1 RimK family alpha-L-glutamate ligase [Flavobacteriaceae bacterium]NNK53149.1 RimK family alpha-L-glutamate ligase [Flavobacteriaceae bacterium]
MNIAIISRGESLYSTRSLFKAGESRNHVMEVLDPTRCTQAIENGKPVLYFNNELIADLHAVIPRIGASNTYFGAALVRHFQSMGVFCVVRAEPILQSRNKWTCNQILAHAKIPVPETVLGTAGNVEAMLGIFGDPPYIIKILQGTHGQGVILAETYQSALSTVETLLTAKVRFVIQEFIAESDGSDLRVIVVDGAVIAAMKRQSRAGEFRSNLHRGGSSQEIKLTYAEENLALRAAKALRLGVCGVDILQSNRGPLVLEVNSTPGLEGIETTTGISIASKIISYIERNKRK